jgi:hypothetical protein
MRAIAAGIAPVRGARDLRQRVRFRAGNTATRENLVLSNDYMI